ncbi:hypothetical protein SVAN01_00219 [Stagonosporopsis vannaccii]|nr:hypothetical protein SVAN01_00219 [Stagonosporopsis vannaccii]
MNLSSLAPELKLHIIEFLDLVPTLHFALTSKEHLALSQGRMKEHAMFTKYSTIQTTYDGTLIWDLTKEVLIDPRKGWYVRELNLIAGRPDVHETLSEEDKTLFRTAANKLLPVYPRELNFFAVEDSAPRELGDMLDHSITRGFEDAILVILIHHLPQLRVLRMADMFGGDCFLAFMRRVAACYQNPALATHMPLQHLKTVQVAHSDTEFCMSVDWAVYFICVPSLRTFAAFMMGSEGVAEFHADVDSEDNGGSEAHLRNIAGTPVSNVEELMFYQCQFDPQTFNTILPLIKNLKRFCYHAAGHIAAYADYEPRKVIRALANHAADFLEELQLAECEMGFEESEQDIAFVSARGFKKLKALHCEARWLLPKSNDDLGNDEPLSQGFHIAEEEPEESKDPRDNLPETLEYLYLDGVYDYDEWHQLTDIFDTTNLNTPKLTLENTGLMCGGDTNYGRAPRPEDKFGIRQLEEIRDRLQILG